MSELQRGATNGAWKLSPLSLNGFHVWVLERQTGPCLRWDYEFLKESNGEIRQYRNRMEAAVACAELNAEDLFKEAA